MPDSTLHSLAEAILVDHQRHRGGCLCGWADLGKSFARHQVAMLSEAGLLNDADGAPSVTDAGKARENGNGLVTFPARKSTGPTAAEHKETDVTPAEIIEATATDMRKVLADIGDAKRPWFIQNPGGYPQSIRSTGIVYVIAEAFDQPPHGATATYISTWDPTVTAAVADWLDETVADYADLDPASQRFVFEAGEPAGAAKVCRAWWASRGIDPEGGRL